MRRRTFIPYLLASAILAMATFNAAHAQCPALPNQLTNGQTADATQVMANFDQLRNCLNSGDLTVPPVSSLAITGAGGGTATIQNPAATSNYDLNLPIGPGTAGQILTSAGPGNPMTWATLPAAVPPPIVDGIPVGRPAASSLSWMNQGGASDTEHTNGPITLTIPAQSGDELRGLGQSPPASAPYTLTVKIDTLLAGSNYYASGIYVRDSNGKLLTIAYQTTNGHAISIQTWNSTASFNANVKQKPISPARTWWLRVNNDGTNWTFSVSHNGADWIPFYSQGLTAFLGSTITDLGVFGDNNDTASTGLSSMISIWSFELAAGSGTNSSWQ